MEVNTSSEKSENLTALWASFNESMNENALLDAHYEWACLLEELEQNEQP